MAPELFDERPYSAKVDVYAFGVLLNEMFTRERPFGELQEPSAIRAKVLDGGRPDLFRGGPQGLQDLIQACWAQAPEDRPTVGDVSNRLATLAGRC